MSIKSLFEDIADAIREKSGSSDTYTPAEMPGAILDISSGGVETMTRAEWSNLTVAERQSYGLLGIIDENTGFERGVIVYGEDYEPLIELISVYNIGEGSYSIDPDGLIEFNNVGVTGGAIINVLSSSPITVKMELIDNTVTVQFGACTKTATLPTIITNGTGRVRFTTKSPLTYSFNPQDNNLFMGTYENGSYKMKISLV